MSGYIAVKNFERFQHYKDRKPTWIKLYNDLLDDYEFGCLPDASKWLAVGLWLLASRHENRIPADPRWIARMVHASETVNLQALLTAGFIEPYDDASDVLAEPEQPASLEEEREEESESEKKSLSSSVIQLRAREDVSPDLSANEIIRAANRGMMDNPHIGSAANPIPVGHSSRQDVLDWLAGGVPPDIALRAVHDRASSYKPEGTRRQITTMRYFAGVVADAYERWKAEQTEVSHGGSDRSGAGASTKVGVAPPPKRDKFAAHTETADGRLAS
jgi:hypothetical protein